MAKILLLDFDEKDRQLLVEQEFNTELRSTSATTDEEGIEDLPSDCETIFYQMNVPAQDERTPVQISPKIARLVEQGGSVVCFLGAGPLFHLASVIGTFPELHFQEMDPEETLVYRPKPPFSLIFDKFQPFIVHAYKLFQDMLPETSWDMGSSVNGTYEFLAKSPDGVPVSLLIRKGRGFFLLLPSFGPRNIEVADFVLKNVLLTLGQKNGNDAWVDSEEYTFPVLTQLFARKEEEQRRHEQALQDIEEKIHEARMTEQEAFNKLLKSEGQELKKAIINAFEYLEWGKVVDVDDYWKKTIRSKEEDIWLIETANMAIEACLQREPLLLVLVRANKNWATDDDCALLQKYKGRRMQEFGNTKMKAVLVGNFFSTQEAKLRDNPFAPIQVEEAQKDGNALLTTYELFKAVKAEKEGRTNKESIRNQLKEKVGLIKFEL